MHAPEDQIFEFGDFVLAPKERLLLCGGDPVPLTPKAFDMLVVLVRRSGHLVSKDDLLREVWPDTFVEEVNLTVNISALRKTLDRGRNGNGMIQTVPTRGYRFVAPVMARDAALVRALGNDSPGALDHAPELQLAAPVGAVWRRYAAMGRGGALLILALTCVLIGATALWRTMPDNTNVQFSSVAVLPFDADGPGSSYLADGLTEATINSLVQLRSLRVAPRTSAFHYKGLRAKPRDAGRELGVAAVVTASVSQRDDLLRIQVDLVDVARDFPDLGRAVPRRCVRANSFANTNSTRPLAGVKGSALRPGDFTACPADYRELGCLPRLSTGPLQLESEIRRGAETRDRAFQARRGDQPRFAPAYSGLADCYTSLGYLSYISPAEAFPAARRHATKALELDPSLSEAHASLGFVKLYFDWDWPAAEMEFQRAIALDPNYAASYEWYSIYLLAAGRAEAFREIQLARQSDPLSLSINSDLGFHYYYTGRYDEAVKQLKFVLEMNKDFPPAHLWLGRTYQELGRLDDALAEFHQVEEKPRHGPFRLQREDSSPELLAAPMKLRTYWSN